MIPKSNLVRPSPSFERVLLLQIDKCVLQIILESVGVLQHLFGRNSPLAFQMNQLFPRHPFARSSKCFGAAST